MVVPANIINNLDPFAIVAAAVAAWIVGGVWYGALGKHWLAALGKTRGELPKSMLPMALSFVADLVLAFVIALAINIFTSGAATVQAGLICAFVLWAGFVLTTLTVNNAFAGRAPMLVVIDAGHWLAAMLTVGVVIGLFG